ncbi:MAG: hypothetical protein H6797_04315 [Candidatus Nomurabacteria bacterium]|nr:MAG: hypothetical protein H6797_04315 [Candidatus Nomurabacteria bacterium]
MNHEFTGEDDFKLEGTAFIDMRILDQLSDIKDLCTAFAEKPLLKNGDPLEKAASAHLSAVRIALEQIDDESGSVENINEMIEYARGLEIQRVAFLNEISGSKDEPYTVANDAFDSLRSYLLESESDDNDDESVAEQVLELYQMCFQADMNQLSAISAENYEQKPSVKRKELLKKIGFQALDVAKVGLGVFVGIAAAKKSKLI